MKKAPPVPTLTYENYTTEELEDLHSHYKENPKDWERDILALFDNVTYARAYPNAPLRTCEVATPLTSGTFAYSSVDVYWDTLKDIVSDFLRDNPRVSESSLQILSEGEKDYDGDVTVSLVLRGSYDLTDEEYTQATQKYNEAKRRERILNELHVLWTRANMKRQQDKDYQTYQQLRARFEGK